MNGNDQPEILPPLRLSAEAARKAFPEGTPTSGRFMLDYYSTADILATQEKARTAAEEEAQKQRAREERALLEQTATENLAAKKTVTARRLLGAFAACTLFVLPSAVNQFRNNTETENKTAFNDIASGIAFSIPYYIDLGQSLGEKFFGGKGTNTPDNASALVATPTPETSPSTPASPTSIPTPSATKTVKLAMLPSAKEFVSIQTPQKQPFTYPYKKDSEGNILGYTGVYKASSGITPEEVQWIESCGNTTDNVLLSFDDTGSESHIREIAKILKDNKVGAIFFLNTNSSPDGGSLGTPHSLIDDLREDGFYVGNHSATHPDMTKLSDSEIHEEIVAGGPANLVRLPYGATYKDKKSGNVFVDDHVLQVAQETGAAVCGWTGDTRDWSSKATVKSMLEEVKRDLRPGANFLMHVHNKNPTLAALPEIIKLITAEGYNLCPLAGEPTSADFSETKICVPAKK